MWRSRLRTTFLSSQDEVDAGEKPEITHKTGYDIYRMLPPGVCSFSHFILNLLPFLCRPCVGVDELFCRFWFCAGLCDLQMCSTTKRCLVIFHSPIQIVFIYKFWQKDFFRQKVIIFFFSRFLR